MRHAILYILLMVLLVLLVGVVNADIDSIDVFDNQYTVFNITYFFNGSNQTNYLNVPRYAYLLNLSFNIKTNDTVTNDSIYDILEVSINGTFDPPTLVGYMGIDGNADTYSRCFGGDATGNTFFNVSKYPDSQFGTFTEMIYSDDRRRSNMSIPRSCWDSYPNKLQFFVRQSSKSTNQISVMCYNATEGNYTNMWNYTHPNGERLYEFYMHWNLSNETILRRMISKPADLYIVVDNTTIYRHEGQSPPVNLSLSEIFNEYVNDSCQCYNCSQVDTYCHVGMLFHSSIAGILEVSLSNSTYTYGVDSCNNSYNIESNATALNVSFFDENGVTQHIDLGTTVYYYYMPNTTTIGNFSVAIEDINNMSYCIYPSWANFTANLQIEYTDAASNIFNYFTSRTLLDNVTDQLNLYTQNGTSQVLFSVVDTNGDEVPNAFIHILKYDVGTGAYTATEILETDSQGQAVGNIVLATTFYNFLIYYEGNLVYTEQAVKLIATTRTFTVNLVGADWYDDYDTTLNVNTNLYFNDDTNNFVYTWSDPSGLMHEACLRVDLMNDSGKYNLSDSCVEATSGTIIYNIPVLQNGTEYSGVGYLRYDNIVITDIVYKIIEKVRDFFGQDPRLSLFYGFIITLLMFLVGLPNPAVGVLLLVVGIIFSAVLGLWQISMLQLGSIVILGIVQMYIGSRQEK